MLAWQKGAYKKDVYWYCIKCYNYLKSL